MLGPDTTGGLRRSYLIALLVLGLAALGLTACGGGSSHPTPTPPRNDAMAIVTPTPGTPPPRTPTPIVTRRTYVVKPGDTLSSIADQFGVSQDAIQRANNISDPNSIEAGQTLKIP